MLARLWWKDARQFGPAWGAIALMALVGFLLAGRYLPDEDGVDTSIWGFAILFSGLYALAIATAAIAGERENGTLRLLDTLPAPRGRLWDAKASFAVVSSLALTLVLLLIAATQVNSWEFDGLGGPGATLGKLLLVLALILEAIGWGLFWSALVPNVLAAAALAACCLLLLLPALAPVIGERTPTILMPSSTPIRLWIAIATAGLSRVVFLASGPPHRPWKGVRTQTPGTGQSVASPSDHVSIHAPSGSSWTRALASLAWQASREARSAWQYLVLLGLGVPVLGWLAADVIYGLDPFGLSLFLCPVVALLAGVGVFHAEQRGRSFRLLTHHGVRPAIVWPIKVAVWSVGLMLIWVPLSLFLLAVGPRPTLELVDATLAYLGLTLASFSVGLLCGMAIRRGITAALIGVVLLVALIVPVGLMIGIRLLDPRWTIVLPLALLAASWAWTGPWMLDRPGASRWVRLGGLVLLFVGPLLPLYAGLRVWPMPDPGPLPAELRTQLTVSRAGEGDDAGPLYREAYVSMMAARLEFGGMGASMGGPALVEAQETHSLDDPRVWLDAHAEAIDIARRASILPYVRFGSLEGRTVFDWGASEDVPVMPVADLLWVVVDRRRQIGDMDGAWEDLLTLFRMSRQPFEPRTARNATILLGIEEQTLRRAMNWAMSEQQTPELLRNALESFQMLDPPPDPLLVIATEQVIAEQTLDLPRETLRDGLARSNTPSRSQGSVTPGLAAWTGAISTPWEIERARRVLRTVLGDWRIGLDRGPFRSVIYEPYRVQREAQLLNSSPLAEELVPPMLAPMIRANDQNEVDRRALVQILALRAWQLEHDGRWPDRLQDLVPSELDRLPDDPYKPGQPFGYVGSSTDASDVIGSLNWLLGAPRGPSPSGLPVILLYSIGPDAVDQRGAFVLPRNQIGQGDIVYPLPDDRPRPQKAGDPVLESPAPD